MPNIFTRSLGPGGPTSLQRLLDMPDPMLSFKWICLELPKGFYTHYIEAIDLPFNNINIGDKAHGGASYTYYPSTHDIAAFNMTFYEDMYGNSSRYLWEWKSKVKDFNTGFYGLPGVDGSGYKQTVKVRLLDAANRPVIDVKLLGVWPADTGNLGLNYTDTSGRITIAQTFSVDGQELKFYY
jgi:hypothetical protein